MNSISGPPYVYPVEYNTRNIFPPYYYRHPYATFRFAPASPQVVTWRAYYPSGYNGMALSTLYCRSTPAQMHPGGPCAFPQRFQHIEAQVYKQRLPLSPKHKASDHIVTPPYTPPKEEAPLKRAQRLELLRQQSEDILKEISLVDEKLLYMETTLRKRLNEIKHRRNDNSEEDE